MIGPGKQLRGDRSDAQRANDNGRFASDLLLFRCHAISDRRRAWSGSQGQEGQGGVSRSQVWTLRALRRALPDHLS
jgi:hypothetical protein